ncbi:MAG: Tn3 family transposase [Streptosporangiaceae bacterium]
MATHRHRVRRQSRPAHRTPQRPRRDRAHPSGCRPRACLTGHPARRGGTALAGGGDRRLAPRSARLDRVPRRIHPHGRRRDPRAGPARDAVGAVFHGQRGQLRKHYQVGQENQLDSLGIMVNVIVLWQTVYTQAALEHRAAAAADP